MGYLVESIDRQQSILLPECLGGYVYEDSAFWAINAFINMLGLSDLGFQALPAATGRPRKRFLIFLANVGTPMSYSPMFGQFPN